MTKRKVKPVAPAPEAEPEIYSGGGTEFATPEPSDGVALWAGRHVAGASVVYVALDGLRIPATITDRYGTHSELLLAGGASVLSARYDQDGQAPHSYHFAE